MPLLSSIPRTTTTAAIAALLAMGMLATAHASVSAQAGDGMSGHFGIVTDVGANEFAIKKRNGAERFLLIETTSINIGNERTSIDVLREDQRVAVTTRSGPDGLIAVQIMIIPSEPLGTHLRVTIVERTPQAVVARDRHGNEVRIDSPMHLPDDAEGDVITLVADRASSRGGGAGGSILLRNEEAIPTNALTDRLGEQMREARRNGDPELSSALEARLLAAMEVQLTRLAATVEQLPDQGRERVESAITRNVDAFDRTLRESGFAEGTPEVQAASGVLHEVNQQEANIVLEARNASGLRILVDDQTRVEVNGRPGTLGGLAVGDEITLRFNVRTRTATHITANTGNVATTATISSVNAAGRQVSLRLRTGELWLRVTDDTRVSINGFEASLPDLRPGMPARVTFDSRSQEALAIAAQATVDASGTLLRIDSSSGEVSVETGGETGGGETLVLTVTPRSRVEVNGVSSSLSRLDSAGAGGRIAVSYDTRSSEILTLSARIQTVPTAAPLLTRAEASGEIAGFGARSILIRETNGVIELHVTVDTRIILGDRLGSWDELREGLQVRATYDRDSLDALTLTVPMERAPGEGAQREQVTGRIISADTSSLTLTLLSEDGRTVELVLSRATGVSIAGRPGTFADLVRGASATVALDGSSRTALLVTIRPDESGAMVRPLPQATDDRPATRALTGRFVEYQGGRFVVNTGSGNLILPINSEARVTIEGQAATIARLQAGMGVSIEVNANGIVVAVDARSGTAPSTSDPTRPALETQPRQINGSLGEVVESRRSIVIRTSTGAVTVTIGPGTRIVLNGVSSSLAALQPGMTAIAYVDADGIAASIEARGGTTDSSIPPTLTDRLTGDSGR